MKLIINTDGGARGNPGPAGIGVVIQTVDKKVLEKFGKYLGDNKTNNQAEYTAVIEALKAAKKLGGTHLEFRMDSELAVRQLNHIYKVKNAELQQLFLEIKNLQTEFSHVTFTHIPRAQNSAADKMVNEAIDKHE
ncbi:MAG: hypothetical protein A2751_04145 [Candidatus Doudnabacteria bacterium RIFCSPHIGHO2_01_FULL_46_14]|uniref:RNase H type-1 domain-containing protein n=1 Tax=Candidatus Doudnabacteria bacterium RIFCSPHIGHO2_01_FULL_46_14 TaxID=1817824 RepID=A0A1F5NL86_9BACT|nr:MAG: hypothetical protein A2751_04145 [Candidatus Doudnabacteria bacterium RIFCSPHIGHO2_01_FULL_46_14]